MSHLKTVSALFPLLGVFTINGVLSVTEKPRLSLRAEQLYSCSWLWASPPPQGISAPYEKL